MSNVTTSAAIYCRISADRQGTSLGVERQRQLCEKLAAEKGWPVGQVYTDNDISAYSGKPRPGYNSMLRDLEAGSVDAVICVDLDRLTRQPSELESFILLADRLGIPLANVSGDTDLSSSDGRFKARIMGAVARQESERKSERLRRQKDQAATKGLASGGRRRYGYEPTRNGNGEATLEIVEHEAETIRKLAERILAGDSLRSLAQDLNDRDIPTTSGKQWRGQTVRATLESPTVAGLRVHRGQVVGEGNWLPILDRATWEQVRSVMAGRGRVKPGRPGEHLLSGMLKCSKCGATLYYRTRTNKRPSYVCQPQADNAHCGGTSISAEQVEQLVSEAIQRNLSDVRARRKPVTTAEPSSVELVGQIEALEDRMKRLSELHWGEGRMSEAEYLAGRDAIETQISDLREQLGESTTSEYGEWEPVNVIESWGEADLDRKRKALSAMIESVTVLPGKRGSKTLDPERVDIKWRGM